MEQVGKFKDELSLEQATSSIVFVTKLERIRKLGQKLEEATSY